MVSSDLEIPEWLHWLDSCPSTNTWAIAQLPALKDGDVVFTPQQTAGRGQHGRIWYSPPGVLTASFVLDQIPVAQLSGLSLAAGLAVIYAIEDLLPDLQHKLRLKWTNDILIDGCKLAGILCESRINVAVGPVVVGIGLNRSVNFEQVGLGVGALNRAISLHQVSAIVPDQILLLERLRDYLLQTAGLLRLTESHADHSTGLAALLPAIRSRDALLGHRIRLDLGAEKISGEAVGINDRGHLLLRLPDGEVRSFVSGHIVWQNCDEL